MAVSDLALCESSSEREVASAASAAAVGFTSDSGLLSKPFSCSTPPCTELGRVGLTRGRLVSGSKGSDNRVVLEHL